MKKEISDHLASAFFDRQLPKKKVFGLFWPTVITLCVAMSLVFIAFLIQRGRDTDRPQTKENLSLQRYGGPYRLKYDFSSADTPVQTVTIDLSGVDLSTYAVLKFNLRFINRESHEPANVRVSIENKRQEISSLYLSQVNDAWTRVLLSFDNFKNITDWPGITDLSFSLEEWNLRSRKGMLLIDDLEFVKNRL